MEARPLAELAADPDVIAEVQAGVDEVNEQFAQVEQIKKFTLLGEEWLPDTDVLTPTSKLKRRGVNARYADGDRGDVRLSGDEFTRGLACGRARRRVVDAGRLVVERRARCRRCRRRRGGWRTGPGAPGGS